MPKINGILETALYVEDIERSVEFYKSVFGFQEIDASPRLSAMGVVPRQVLLLFKKEASAHLPLTPHDGSGQVHLAFAIAASELEAWETWLPKCAIAIEERKTWERGGTSLYFRDPDGHLLELATPGVWSIY
jgi:catechol 2,3-dioxygenase-like lactoylglutathione lyase family enzyme